MISAKAATFVGAAGSVRSTAGQRRSSPRSRYRVRHDQTACICLEGGEFDVVERLVSRLCCRGLRGIARCGTQHERDHVREPEVLRSASRRSVRRGPLEGEHADGSFQNRQSEHGIGVRTEPVAPSADPIGLAGVFLPARAGFRRRPVRRRARPTRIREIARGQDISRRTTSAADRGDGLQRGPPVLCVIRLILAPARPRPATAWAQIACATASRRTSVRAISTRTARFSLDSLWVVSMIEDSPVLAPAARVQSANDANWRSL